MAGDPLENAFRSELGTILTNAGLASTFPLKDTENTGVQPKVSETWTDLEFHGGTETNYAWGNPGGNWWKENGSVAIGVFTKRNTGHDALGSAALAIRNAFRNHRFPMSSGQTIRVVEVSAIESGKLDGWWMRALLVTYRVINSG